ncbi:MAG: T9SS type A sorting domain-containing protein [Bacteroidia bacterium]|nr:T9SS type A sorting domain-containing protein [Bacteroidia bacterium]
MKVLWVFLSACLLWSQDTVWAEVQLRGDYVEVAFFWRGAASEIPLGANFVLVGEAALLQWDSISIAERGRWDGAFSSTYLPLYLTQRGEEGGNHRVSLNLLSQLPPAGEAFQGSGRESVGRWRVPIRSFGDTLRLRWGMETGEIVLAPLQPAKHRFVFSAIPPIYLCPSIGRVPVRYQSGFLIAEGLEFFRLENLSITWYRDGVVIGNGFSVEPLLPGRYWAVIRHVCGSEGSTDSVEWRASSQTFSFYGGWKVYPQPTQGDVWIQAPVEGAVQVVLRDILGRVVHEKTYVAQANTAEHLRLPATLAAGIYQLSLTHENTTVIFPLVYGQ